MDNFSIDGNLEVRMNVVICFDEPNLWKGM